MISDKFQIVLCVLYAGASITCLVEGNPPKALYWFSALLITVSVLWMT